MAKHHGVIPGKMWVRCQEILREKSQKRSNPNSVLPRNRQTPALLSGLIECPLCKRRMTIRSGRDKEFFYYSCRKNRSGSGTPCTFKNLPGKKTDEEVINYLLNYDLKKLNLDLHVQCHSYRVNRAEDKLEQMDFDIKRLEQSKNKYLAHLQKLPTESVLIEEIEKKIKEINAKVADLKSQKIALAGNYRLAINEKSDTEQIIKDIKHFKENVHKLDFLAKKSLLQLIVHKITWSDGQLKVILNGMED